MIALSDIRNSLAFSVIHTGGSEPAVQGTEEPAAGRTIHVWSATYSTLDRLHPYLCELISQEETEKAAGFKKAGDKRRYMLRHGWVRAVLATYTHEHPQEVRFVREKNGKPALDPQGKCPGIRFSLSSTDEMVSLGIIRGTDIGLDIARVLPRDSFPAIGHYLFTQKENLWIARAALDLRYRRFIRIWCLKEALLKAAGSDVHLMKEADVSGIMTDTYLNGRYLIPAGGTARQFCIHESGCCAGHHRVIATVPAGDKDPQIMIPPHDCAMV